MKAVEKTREENTLSSIEGIYRTVQLMVQCKKYKMLLSHHTWLKNISKGHRLNSMRQVSKTFPVPDYDSCLLIPVPASTVACCLLLIKTEFVLTCYWVLSIPVTVQSGHLETIKDVLQHHEAFLMTSAAEARQAAETIIGR